jgi:hypothetical protein
VAKVQLSDKPDDAPLEIFVHPVALNFPPLKLRGKIPQERMITSAHEFGHAYVAVRLGLRIEYITVVPPKNGVGGYVKYQNGDGSAEQMLARIYSAVASRALERIALSSDPRASESSMAITSGASSDIKSATKALYNMLYELGFDPNGGTVDHLGVQGAPYANFASIPEPLVEKLGLVLRDMEDYVVEDLMSAHPKEWYAQKIAELASEGGMNEEEFLKLVEFSPDQAELMAPNKNLAQMFGKFMKLTPTVKTAKLADDSTVTGNKKDHLNYFFESLRRNLHPVVDRCEGLLTNRKK